MNGFIHKEQKFYTILLSDTKTHRKIINFLENVQKKLFIAIEHTHSGKIVTICDQTYKELYDKEKNNPNTVVLEFFDCVTKDLFFILKKNHVFEENDSLIVYRYPQNHPNIICEICTLHTYNNPIDFNKDYSHLFFL